jgi:hypothetical protein
VKSFPRRTREPGHAFLRNPISEECKSPLNSPDEAYRSGLPSASGKAALIRLKPYHSARKRTAPTALDDLSFIQYRHADAEHAEAVLQTFAVSWEELKKLSPVKGHDLHLANTYTRLAYLEHARRKGT